MKKIDWRLVAIASGNFAHGSATMGVIGLLNEIAADLDVSIATAGQITTGMQLSAAIGAPLVAFFGGNLARRTVLMLALLITAGCQFAAALAPVYALLLVARTLSGFGAAAYAPTAAATAAQLVEPEQRGRALAAVFMGFALASILGVPIGVWMGGLFGWRIAMAGFSVLALLALLWVAALVPGKLARGAGLERGAWAVVLKNRAIVAMIGFNLLHGSAQMLVFTYIAPLLRVALDAGPGTISLVLGWIGLWSLIGSILAMQLTDRLGPARMLGLGVAGMIAATAGWTAASGSLPLMLLLLAVWGVSSMVVFIGVQAQIVHLDPRVAGVALALLLSTNFWGGVIGPALGGILIASFGLSLLPWAGAAMYACGALVLAVALRLARPRVAGV